MTGNAARESALIEAERGRTACGQEPGAQGAAGPSGEWLLRVFDLLFDHFGPRGWWPADTPYEVAVGAILTQSVSWRNVERAIQALKEHGLLDPRALYRAPSDLVERLIVPARYYRQKARKLLAFTAELVERYGGDMAVMLAGPTADVRARLLGLWGIGEETADSILLYAGGHPVFVVDAYTRRIFHRLGVWPESIGYREMQSFFHSRLPADVRLFNEFHALIDGVGNRYCAARNPRCSDCPLVRMCEYGRGRIAPRRDFRPEAKEGGDGR